MTAFAFSARPHPGILLLAFFAAFMTLLGVTGVTQHVVFEEPSTLKYGMTVFGPLFFLVAITAAEPLLVIACAIVVAAPFGGFQATVSTYDIPLLLPLLAFAALVIAFEEHERHGFTPMTWAGLATVPLLIVPVANGIDVGDFVRTTLTFVAVAWVVCRAASSPSGTLAIIGAMVVSGVIQAVIAIWEAKTGSQLNLYGGAGNAVFGSKYFYNFEDTTRPIGSLYDPISLGNVLAITGPLMFVLLLRLRGTVRWLLAGSAAVIALGLALSLSRMSWIGFVVGIFVAVALLPRGVRARAATICAIGVVVVSVAAVAVGGESLRERFKTIGNPTSKKYSTGSGDERRIAIWGAALDVFAEHPVEGIGIGRLPNQIQQRVADVGTYTHAHSVYFQLLAEAGILGVALLVTFLVGIWSSIRTALRRDRYLGAGLAGAAVALLICWTTDWVIIYANVAGSVAVLVGLIAAAGRRPARPARPS